MYWQLNKHVGACNVLKGNQMAMIHACYSLVIVQACISTKSRMALLRCLRCISKAQCRFQIVWTESELTLAGMSANQGSWESKFPVTLCNGCLKDYMYLQHTFRVQPLSISDWFASLIKLVCAVDVYLYLHFTHFNPQVGLYQHKE